MQMKNKLCTVRTSYKFYKENVDNPLSLREYMTIVYGFFAFLLKEVLATKEISIPHKLGKLSITGTKIVPRVIDGKIKGLPPDWKATNELWKTCEECKENKQLVFHLNEHSSGIRYKFKWSKKNVLVENKYFYYFRPARAVKRELAKLINEGKEFFI